MERWRQMGRANELKEGKEGKKERMRRHKGQQMGKKKKSHQLFFFFSSSHYRCGTRPRLVIKTGQSRPHFFFFCGSFETASLVSFQCRWCVCVFFFWKGWTGYITAIYAQIEPQIAAKQAGDAECGSEEPPLLCFVVFFCAIMPNRTIKGDEKIVSSPGMTLERKKQVFFFFNEKEFLSVPRL